MLDPRWYEGREQALVKHTFLDSYMPAQIPKVVKWADTFAYVDLYAGPWQSNSGDFSDTSFGIALRCMSEAKATQARLNRSVKMLAHLVGVGTENRNMLVEASKRYPDVETHCHLGTAEEHANTIAASIPTNAFRFVVIDPKGIPDVRLFRCLIEADKTEVLLNFMFQFANRFAGSKDRMPTLEGWLGNLDPEEDWRSIFAGLSGGDREAAITERARQVLKAMGQYRFAPAITVDETNADRPLYKLIYLSRHPAGIKVFRQAHYRALEIQATYRSAKKAENRRRLTGMDDMFSQPDAMEPGERSAQAIAGGEYQAEAALLRLLSSQPEGRTWSEIWPEILDDYVVSFAKLGSIANNLRQRGIISSPTWQGNRIKIPRDEFRLCLAAQ